MKFGSIGRENPWKLIGLLTVTGLAAQIFGQRVVHDQVRSPATIPSAGSISSGQVVAHEVGELVIDGAGNCQLVGYFPYIANLPVTFFSGTPSEATAYFTFRSPPFQLQIVPNGNLMQIFPLGTTETNGLTTYSVYYNVKPNQSFANPASFSQGQLIGTFTSQSWMATLGAAGGTVAGTFTLASTADFTIQGQTYNLSDLGSAVTLEFTVGVPPAGFTYGSVSIPFGGFGLQADSSRGVHAPR